MRELSGEHGGIAWRVDGHCNVTILSLNVNSLSSKLMHIAALLEALAAEGVVVTIIALQETKLNPAAHIVTGTDLPGFSIIRKDVKKGKGGVCFFVRDDILVYEHTEVGISDLSTLWIRAPQVLPPLQIGVTYLSPTDLSARRAHEHFFLIDKVTSAAEAAGLEWILLGDLNARGLNALEAWLHGIKADPDQLGAFIVSGSSADTDAGNFATRFAVHQGFAELDFVVASKGAAALCASCRTENGHGSLRNPIKMSDHRALVATFRVKTLQVAEAGGDGVSFSPVPLRKAQWCGGTQDEKDARIQRYSTAVEHCGGPLLDRAADVLLTDTPKKATWLIQKIAGLVHRCEDAAGISRTGAGGPPKPKPAFFDDAPTRCAFAAAALRNQELEVAASARDALVDAASREVTLDLVKNE
ncbi:Endonuclease/exonuclease/phosphatase [Pelagophyceae sp. CCMP2097]|nr:Endonuclease/exonuclease/phosphatase [Pelagophyceae sp. CCMP2097]